MFRFKILQMRMQHPEEKIDIVGRLRNFEAAFVTLFVRKSDPQCEFFGDEINRTQPQRELLQKPAEHKKEWLSRFDFVFELEAFFKRLRWLNKFKEPIRSPICAFPQPDCFRPEPHTELFLIERSELSKRVNAPLVQDRQDLLNLSLSIFCGCGIQQKRAVHARNLRSK